MTHAYMGKLGQTTKVLTCILGVLGSNNGWDTVLIEIFLRFPQIFQENARKLKLVHGRFLSYCNGYAQNIARQMLDKYPAIRARNNMTIAIARC
jgi:hypothetical protein